MVQHIHIEETEDDVGAPPPEFMSKFTTLRDWLDNVCNNNPPQKTIEKYTFGLFEGDDYILFLVGTNSYQDGPNQFATRIEFEPTGNYFQLPQDEYKDQTREQLIDKLTIQLTDFTNTNTFQNSFLSKANTIHFETNGQVIWEKDR